MENPDHPYLPKPLANMDDQGFPHQFNSDEQAVATGLHAAVAVAGNIKLQLQSISEHRCKVVCIKCHNV